MWFSYWVPRSSGTTGGSRGTISPPDAGGTPDPGRPEARAPYGRAVVADVASAANTLSEGIEDRGQRRGPRGTHVLPGAKTSVDEMTGTEVLEMLNANAGPNVAYVNETNTLEYLERIGIERAGMYHFLASGGLRSGLPAAVGTALGDPETLPPFTPLHDDNEYPVRNRQQLQLRGSGGIRQAHGRTRCTWSSTWQYRLRYRLRCHRRRLRRAGTENLNSGRIRSGLHGSLEGTGPFLIDA